MPSFISQPKLMLVSGSETQTFAVVSAATWPPFLVFISESSFQSPSSFQHVNVDGTKVLLGAAYRARHQPRRFIYVSTDEVYGASTDQVSQRRFVWQAGWPQSHCDRLVLLRRSLMRAVQWGRPILILLPKQLQSSWSHPTGTNIRYTWQDMKKLLISDLSISGCSGLNLACCVLSLMCWQFPVIITRSNNIYGPRQYTEKVRATFVHLF